MLIQAYPDIPPQQEIREFIHADSDLSFPDFLIAPRLPREKVAEEFLAVRRAFEERWSDFSRGREFIFFKANRSNEELEKEFRELNRLRLEACFKDPRQPGKESRVGFEICQSLLAEDRVRVKSRAAFAYNNTVPYYNASTICLGDKYCIACEGPRSKDIPRFFQMLYQYQITHLVRLTRSYEGSNKKCHPYWEDSIEALEGECILQVPLATDFTYPVRYFIEERWEDQKDFEVSDFLALAQQVLSEIEKEEGSLLGVHCSAGVGRTGTFLALIHILLEIRHAKIFSIQEIVLRLSLQRCYCVSTAEQYISLYRAAELYLQELLKIERIVL